MARPTSVKNPSPRQRKIGPCQLCYRETHLTFHHLIPRKAHRRKAFRKRYSAAQLQQGISVCKLCHNAIHKFYDELWLARNLNTLDLLRADAQLHRHIQWTSKQRVAMQSTMQPGQAKQSIQTDGQMPAAERNKKEDQ